MEVVAVDGWFWILLACVTAVPSAVIGWWRLRPRRAFKAQHIRVELHGAHIVEDRLVEVLWRSAVSMTNNSRRPRALPVLAARATVRAGHRVYLARICLDADVSEINPGDVALAWVQFVLPAEVVPRRCNIVQLRGVRSTRKFRLAVRPAMIPADRQPRAQVR